MSLSPANVVCQTLGRRSSIRTGPSKSEDSIRVPAFQQHMTAHLPTKAFMPMFSSDARLWDARHKQRHSPNVTAKEAWHLRQGIGVADHRGAPTSILQTEKDSYTRRSLA